MNARQIKRAWEEFLPINPGEPPVECSYIKQIIYDRTNKGKKKVSCVCVDKKCPHSYVQARARNIKLKEDFDNGN